MASTPKKKEPPDPPLAVTLIRSMLCFPFCSNCSDKYGSTLPCSALSSKWLIRFFRVRSSPLSPESLMFCGGLASCSCRRPSIPAIVPIVRIRAWVRSTTYEFACCFGRVPVRSSTVSSVDHPSCAWIDTGWRLYSVIFPVEGVAVQRGGIGTRSTLRVIQVCGLPLLSIPLLFMLPRLMPAPALFSPCDDFGMTPPCFCISPCNICVKLNLVLPLDMVVV